MLSFQTSVAPFQLLQHPLLAVEVFGDHGLQAMLAAVVYAIIGLALFGVVWVAIVQFTPFSIRKEIEEDQNIALGVILAAILLGMALIISSAIRG
jgi:uncharacterized membrane protein YjfL (UPF0719 family)